MNFKDGGAAVVKAVSFSECREVVYEESIAHE